MLQAAAQPAGLDPDDRVGDGIETRITVEDVYGNGIGLDLVGIPGKRFLHNELQKPFFPFGIDDFPAAEDTPERVLNELGWDRVVDIV